MLPAALLLAAGIVISSWRAVPLWISVAGAAVGVATAALSLRSHRAVAVTAVGAALIFIGAALTAVRMRADAVADGRAVFRISIADEPQLHQGARTSQCDARIIMCRDSEGVWQRRHGRLRIHADTALHLAAGRQIVCRGRVRPFAGDGYDAMMRRKGYAGRLYIGAGDILRIEGEGHPPTAVLLHRRAVARVAQLPLQPENMAVARAVGTGDASMLGRGQRAGYSRAGTAHLLALSGLHVGIVYIIINIVLRLLPLFPYGHLIGNASAILLLWLYVLSTGMSPSAVRAAVMFSIMQTSRAISADYSPLNAAACAAFISLCFDPSLLFDAGFQLSYIAVAAIIICALPLCRRLHIDRRGLRNRFAKASAAAVNFIADTLAVGFVATAATAPLVSHLFGVIPLAGIAAGPAAVAAAAATVALTAVWIALPSGIAAQAAPAFGRAIDLTAGAMNAISESIASRPWAALDIRLTGSETIICYAVAAVAALLLATHRNNRRQSKKIRMK